MDAELDVRALCMFRIVFCLGYHSLNLAVRSCVQMEDLYFQTFRCHPSRCSGAQHSICVNVGDAATGFSVLSRDNDKPSVREIIVYI